MEYKVIDKTSYKLHLIKTDKFKTITIRIMFNDLISKEDITIRNFLSDLLIYSNKEYNTRKKFVEHIQDLYAPSIYVKSFRTGKYSTFNLFCSMLNEKYTESGMFDQTVKFLADILFRPNVDNGKFDAESFKYIYNVFSVELKNIKENPDRYSAIRMLEEMGNDYYSYRDCGYLEDLDTIDEENVYQYYKKLINKSLVDIYVIGDIDDDIIISTFDKYMEFNTFKREKENSILIHDKYRKHENIVMESEDNSQSKLTIGCKLKDLTERERNYVITLYNIILGSSPESRFFKNIREKHSICYHISSSLNKIDNLLLIRSGISKENFDICLKLVKEEMNDIKKGNITDVEVENAKNVYLTRLDEIMDSSEAIINTYVAMDNLNLDDVEERKNKIMTVTKDEIIEVANKIYMDTVFLFKGEKENGED